MKSNKLTALAAVAILLVTAAYLSTSYRNVRSPNVIGKKLLPNLDLSEIARIEIKPASGEEFVLEGTEGGWNVASMHGYPADLMKIRRNILKLRNLKVGQTASARSLGDPGSVVLKDVAGKELGMLKLGAEHVRRADPAGEAFVSTGQFGGGNYPDGRYVSAGEGKPVVLVSDLLSEFNGNLSDWVDIQIVAIPASSIMKILIEGTNRELLELSRTNGVWALAGLRENEELDSAKIYGVESALSYLSFTGIPHPELSEDVLGMTTGVVYTASVEDGSIYTAKVGNEASQNSGMGGSGRYLKLSASFTPVGTNLVENAAVEARVSDFNEKVGRWTYIVPAFSAGRFMHTRESIVKEKPEPEVETSTDGEKAEENHE